MAEMRKNWYIIGECAEKRVLKYVSLTFLKKIIIYCHCLSPF